MLGYYGEWYHWVGNCEGYQQSMRATLGAKVCRSNPILQFIDPMQREMLKCKMLKKHYNRPNPLGLGNLQ